MFSHVFAQPVDACLTKARQSTDVPTLLNLLGETQLEGALEAGVNAVALQAGVHPDRVREVVPGADLAAGLVLLRDARQRLGGALHGHQSELLTMGKVVAQYVIGDLIDEHLGTQDLRLGERLAEALGDFAGDKLREARVQSALDNLRTQVAQFEQRVAEAGRRLDDDQELVALAAAKAQADARSGCGCLGALVALALMVVGGIVYGTSHWWTSRHVGPPETPAPVASSASSQMTAADSGPVPATSSSEPPPRPVPAPGRGAPSRPRMDRQACISQCIGGCGGDANCERTCVVTKCSERATSTRLSTTASPSGSPP